MAIPLTVEIGADLGDNSPISFALDDPVKGVLDNVAYRLGGPQFYDISNRVLSISTRRGKSQALDRIDSGIASIEIDNRDRQFDPLYEAGVLYGQLVPRREIKISSDGRPIYFGYVEDFDLEYRPGNVARVRIDVADAFGALSNALIAELDPPVELSGARVERVLNLPEVNWPADLRDIDAGNSTLLDNAVDEGTPALEYLQLVSASEFGNLFIAKDNKVVFRGRNSQPVSRNLVFTDDMTPSAITKIPFATVDTVYGSENLYTRVSISNADIIPEEVVVSDADSELQYGVRTYSASGLLVETLDELTFLAEFLLASYKDPLYRFEAVSVVLDRLDTDQLEEVLALEIGDIVGVRFEPGAVPPPIELGCRIIGISHDWTPSQKRVSFALETLNFGLFVLDNELFGELDNDRLGY